MSAPTTSQKIADALARRDVLQRALEHVDGVECRRLPACADEPYCGECFNLAVAAERVEAKVAEVDERLEVLAAEAAQEEAAEARAEADYVACPHCDDYLAPHEHFGCEYCAEVMHTQCYYDEHRCFGVLGEQAHARMMG